VGPKRLRKYTPYNNTVGCLLRRGVISVHAWTEMTSGRVECQVGCEVVYTNYYVAILLCSMLFKFIKFFKLYQVLFKCYLSVSLQVSYYFHHFHSVESVVSCFVQFPLINENPTFLNLLKTLGSSSRLVRLLTIVRPLSLLFLLAMHLCIFIAIKHES